MSSEAAKQERPPGLLSLCPQTGLAVLRRPEWSGIGFGGDYRATVSVVGHRILLSQPSGHATIQDVKGFVELLDNVVEATFPDAPEYVQVEDFSQLRGTSFDARRHFIEEMKARRLRVRALVFFGATPLEQLSIALGRRLSGYADRVHTAGSYREAIAMAQRLLGGQAPERPPLAALPRTELDHEIRLPVTTNSAWEAQLGELSVRFELIDGHILHAIASGRFAEEHIEPTFRFHDEVLEAAGDTGQPLYVILTANDLGGSSRQARKRYIERIIQWHGQHPIRMYVFVGANPLLGAAIQIARPFSPFPVRLVRDLGAGLRIILQDRAGESSPGSVEGSASASGEIQPYVDDLLRFLAGIDWESQEAASPAPGTRGSHPFQLVFDAISLIKQDVDDLLRERLKAENAAKLEKAQLERLIDTAPEAIALSDASHRLQRVNREFTRMFGYTADEVIGRHIDDLLAPPELLAEARNASEHVSQTGEMLAIETSRQRKDGTQLDVSLLAARITIDERIVGFYGIYRDISQRRHDDAERRSLESQLAHAQKMEAIGALAGGIAHDFNNVLVPILGYADMARDAIPEGNPAHEHLDEVLAAAKRAQELARQILTFSRQNEEAKRPLRVQPLLQEALKLLRPSLPSTIEIIQDIDHDAGAILADPSHVHQLIMNLCTNAFHAMRDDGGRLEVSLSEHVIDSAPAGTLMNLKPGPHVCLSVSDTGRGIDPLVRRRIFDPYFTTKRPGEGTGMGLAVVHGIIKKYGGDVEVHSEPGKGSRFDVYLPRVDKPEGQDAVQPSGDIVGGDERILCVDDEAQIASFLHQMLQGLGYRASVRTSSVEALQAFRSHPEDYDVVITDQTMPNLTGVALARELLEIRSDIPIILCTGFSEVIGEEEALALGIRAYLMKPVARRDLASAIREVLDAV